MRPLKSLTLEAIVALCAQRFHSLSDQRHPSRINYPLADTLLSGYAMMFFQQPSLLQFQRQMQRHQGRSNLQTLFGVEQVPSDSQMREILDGVPGEPLRALLPELFKRARRVGWMSRFVTHLRQGQERMAAYTLALDGTQYFHSTKLQCPGCLRREDAQGQLHYSHQVVAATLCKPGSHQIWPLEVEQITNGDGSQKQDCELNAAKRLLKRFRAEHRQLPVIMTGDDIYSHEPFIMLLAEQRLSYLLVAQPGTHPETFEWVEELMRMGAGVHGQYEAGVAVQRRFYEYRIVAEVPLRQGSEQRVNFVEVWERDRAGQLLYHNSWVTNLELSAVNVAEVVQIGRSRWKIENEHFNIQKQQGYELEHNYGHGRQTLSWVFYLLNLLAFLSHQILEMGDGLYQQLRELETRRELWNGLRWTVNHLLCRSWAELLGWSLPAEESG